MWPFLTGIRNESRKLFHLRYNTYGPCTYNSKLAGNSEKQKGNGSGMLSEVL